ncbi:MAG TPA: PD-(D/E)XK nuclease family protein [Terracidiphilus sp.]|nr:PD-(D/E)XK nuclease family protein [Terracidiphilus sp.]
MGPGSAAEIDAWLRGGGLVVTASDRAARALASAFHRARRAEGLTAWPAPSILDWKSFVRSAWEEHTLDKGDGRLLLNPVQEQSLWAAIAGTGRHMATLLEGPRHHLAVLAMEAHELLRSYAPRFLRPSARIAWQQDAAAFSGWLAAFDETCRAGNLLSTARLPLELISLLETEVAGRPPLLLAGFDRILPVQRSVFEAWGAWQESVPNQPASQIIYHRAPDTQSELDACALWCSRQLAANPNARLLVVTQNAAASDLRGQIERAFLHLKPSHTGPASSPLFEFSLGVPLSQVALPHAAHLLLRWLSGPLAEHELDWLFSTGHAAANAQESTALQAHMRDLRRRGLQQPYWTFKAFIGQPPDKLLPAAWVNRMTEAQRRLVDFARRPSAAADPLDWAELVPQSLESIHFATARPLSSAEFQAAHRWRQAVESCGSLGFDGRRIPWQEFLFVLARTLDETLFAPESKDAPIQIAGTAESAGLTADAVWFLGASEDAWPAAGSTHPLLPPEVQREAGMPHATPQLDWDLAHAITTRLLASSPEVHFSYAKQNEGVEARPSRLIEQLAGEALELPPELKAPTSPSPLTVPIEDLSRIPFPPGKVEGGANVFTNQSQCPFKAFATVRLAAQGWEPAEAGLTPSQRGQLLHAVLHEIWAGKPDGIRTHADLHKILQRPVESEPDVRRLEAFVAGHVQRALARELRPHQRELMPRRYLELEELRMTKLVTEWLMYEDKRVEFEVVETECRHTKDINKLTLDLRLDRIDRLNDGSLLVIDYKSGDVSPKFWDLPRPDDVQLPLYAAFALEPEEELGGLVFAKVRAGKHEFAGYVRDARATLIKSLRGNRNLVKKPFSDELLLKWQNYIQQLAKNFLAGRAEVDPRDYPKTCERCGLQTLCRIQENQAQLEAEDDPDGLTNPEAADE